MRIQVGPAPLLAVAIITLGAALRLSPLDPIGLALLTLALVATVLAVLVREPPDTTSRRRSAWATSGLIGAGLFWQAADVARSLCAPCTLGVEVGVAAGAACAVVLLTADLSRAVWFVRLRLPVLVAVHFAVGAWIVHRWPHPFIDVYTWHVEAFRALGQGLNPYAITMPNIYDHAGFYGAGLVADGRVQFGFPYPPLSLLLAGAGHLIGGDYRFANLAAMGLSALLIGTCRPGRVPVAAAALFLFTPGTFLVLGWGWTEPYVVLLLAATVWCACRAPALTPLALGLLFAVKQYAVLAAPLVVLLYPRPWPDAGRALLKAALVAAAVTLPFLLWNPAAFVRDLVEVQLRQPFRADSLAYPAAWTRLTGRAASTWPALVVTLAAIALGLRRAGRTPAGFATAASAAFLLFFAFNKQAFANYYFFVVGALCCALAAGAPAASIAEST